MAQSAAGTNLGGFISTIDSHEQFVKMLDVIKANEPKTKTKKIKTSTLRKKPTNTTINNYAHSTAKPYNFLEHYDENSKTPEPYLGELSEPPPENELYLCQIGYKVGHTSTGTFFKSISCGKEYCKHCGRDYSIPHVRRILRVYPKVMQLKKAGYFVITIPMELRHHYYKKNELNALRNYIRRKFKRGYQLKIKASNGTFKKQVHKIEKGFFRFHWCGDDGLKFHPHLNIITETGYLEEYFLQAIKRDLMRYFNNRFNLKYDAKVNLYYQYAPNRKTYEGYLKLRHWINYITRSTATKTLDTDLLTVIHGYRNTTYLGTFEKSKEIPQSRAGAVINNSIDLETGEKIIWEKKLAKPGAVKEILHKCTNLGAGIFFLLNQNNCFKNET